MISGIEKPIVEDKQTRVANKEIVGKDKRELMIDPPSVGGLASSLGILIAIHFSLKDPQLIVTLSNCDSLVPHEARPTEAGPRAPIIGSVAVMYKVPSTYTLAVLPEMTILNVCQLYGLRPLL